MYLGLKKKENQLYSLCSEENSSLIFSHSSIKKTNTNHCIKYKELLFWQNFFKAHSCSITKSGKGIAYTQKYKADTTVNKLQSPWKYTPKVSDRYLLSKSRVSAKDTQSSS